MIIEIDETFKKDFLNIKNKQIQNRVIQKINLIEKIEEIKEISNIKKLKWFNNFYRIRIWDYRIWIEYNWEKIIFLRIRSRKDIYKIFP